jgi:hypothetical protein
MATHLFDLTRGSARHPACGAKSDNIKLVEDFDKLATDKKCVQCVSEREQACTYQRTCRICSLTFASADFCMEHEKVHALEAVSYRGEPVAYVVRTQSFYDSTNGKARALSSAFNELRKWRPNDRFTAVPSRMELTKQGENGVMLGEAHVVDYIIVQT